jgi:hypothetical protein
LFYFVDNHLLNVPNTPYFIFIICNRGVNFMIINTKTGYLVVTAICLTALSLPSYAWQAARGAYGGAAARGNYGGAAVRGPNGGAAVRGPNGNTAYRAPNGNYRAPVPAYGYRGGGAYYNNGYSSGQVAAAGVAGLAVGAMAGAAVANANNQPTNTTVIVQQPAGMVIGTNLNNLPAGCVAANINGIQYFQCSSSWMRSYGSYYQVVPTPY